MTEYIFGSNRLLIHPVAIPFQLVLNTLVFQAILVVAPLLILYLVLHFFDPLRK